MKSIHSVHRKHSRLTSLLMAGFIIVGFNTTLVGRSSADDTLGSGRGPGSSAGGDRGPSASAGGNRGPVASSGAKRGPSPAAKSRQSEAAGKASNNPPSSGSSSGGGGTSQGGGSPAPTGGGGGAAPAADVQPASNFTAAPPVPTPEPEVSIVVTTCLKGKDCNTVDGRLGGVKVKIARKGGHEGCDTKYHSSKSAKTNPIGKDAHGNVVQGTAHFISCRTGTYTVTAVGRNEKVKYKVVGSKVSKPQVLNDNDKIGRVKFILEPVEK